MKHLTTMTVPVELIFEILPALEQDGQHFPAMIDILRVEMTVVGPGGKPRVIDITNTFDESELLALEDDIIENYQDETH